MQIISRTEAATLGLTRYYTGKPCRHGHACERFTSNGVCADCAAKHSTAYRKQIQKIIKEVRAAKTLENYQEAR